MGVATTHAANGLVPSNPTKVYPLGRTLRPTVVPFLVKAG